MGASKSQDFLSLVSKFLSGNSPHCTPSHRSGLRSISDACTPVNWSIYFSPRCHHDVTSSLCPLFMLLPPSWNVFLPHFLNVSSGHLQDLPKCSEIFSNMTSVVPCWPHLREPFSPGSPQHIVFTSFLSGAFHNSVSHYK